MALQLISSAFEAGGSVPRRHSCEGADLSPPLEWSGVPENAVALALIADDPDAPRGTWVHWVLYDLPADVRSIEEGIPKTDMLENGAKQGFNDFKRVGYGGPCPPPGAPHRYFFKLYALSRKLGLPARATKQQVLDAMQGQVLAETELMGMYKR